jgi:hypothetical protein
MLSVIILIFIILLSSRRSYGYALGSCTSLLIVSMLSFSSSRLIAQLSQPSFLSLAISLATAFSTPSHQIGTITLSWQAQMPSTLSSLFKRSERYGPFRIFLLCLAFRSTPSPKLLAFSMFQTGSA